MQYRPLNAISETMEALKNFEKNLYTVFLVCYFILQSLTQGDDDKMTVKWPRLKKTTLKSISTYS